MNARVNQWFAMLLVVLLCVTVQAQEKLQKIQIASAYLPSGRYFMCSGFNFKTSRL